MKNFLLKFLIVAVTFGLLFAIFTPFVIVREKIVSEKTPAIPEKAETLGGIANDPIDLFGTKVLPRAFYTTSQASTTIMIGDDADLLDINIYASEASTTGTVWLNLEKSNDTACNSNSAATMAGITWMDANPQTSASGEVITMDADLTRYAWTPGGNAEGTAITLTDWNAQCLRVTASSTAMKLWVNVKSKMSN